MASMKNGYINLTCCDITTDPKKFRSGYDNINWGRPTKKKGKKNGTKRRST